MSRISSQHVNVINRAIVKVRVDGYTAANGYDLTVGMNDITVVYRDRIAGDGVVTVFNYDAWEYSG